MITNDLSPMLSQPSDDNAQGDLSPMISGRGTKIIADARGAYLARNLAGILAHLNETQQLQFRQAVTRQVLFYLEDFDELEANPVEYAAVQAARHWLNRPLPALSQVPWALLEEGGALNPLGLAIGGHRCRVLTAILARIVQGMPLLEAANSIANYWPDPSNRWMGLLSDPRAAHAEAERLAWRTRHWQIEAAWALLLWHPIPPLDNFQVSNVEALYRAGDLQALIVRMSTQQNEAFCRIMARDVLRHGLAIIPNRSIYGAERRYLTIALAWVLAPTPEKLKSLDEIGTTLLANPSMNGQVRVAVWSAAKLVGAWHASDVEHLAVTAISQIGMINDDDAWHQMRLLFRRWQVEAAWAILQDREPPPTPLAS